MSLQEAFRVSPSVMPGSAEAQKMTVTSGLTCLGALTKSSPIGSFVRTLLESSRWWSKARYLKWQIKPLFSTRATEFQDTNSERPLPFNESATTLAVTDTKSSRYLFRLAVSEPPTDGTECSSSDTVLLQTPTSVQTDETPESMRARAERNGYKNGTKFGSLTSQVKYDPRVQEMLQTLPTPSARDWKGKTNPGVIKEGSGCIYGETLPDAVDRMFGDMLPTPTARDGKNPSSPEGERIARKREQGWTIELNDLAPMGLLPTPRTSEQGNNSNLDAQSVADHRFPNLETVLARVIQREIPVGSDGETSRLSPLFTEEMMGFPFLWTTLPFLSPDGAQKR